jgi:hypothetical protein
MFLGFNMWRGAEGAIYSNKNHSQIVDNTKRMGGTWKGWGKKSFSLRF